VRLLLHKGKAFCRHLSLSFGRALTFCLARPQYTKTIDVWSIGCIFAEILSGKPLFPGRNVVHQLELITDLLGTPSAEEIAKVRAAVCRHFPVPACTAAHMQAQVRNEKARRFLSQMKPKPPVPFAARFPRAHPSAIRLLERLLAFDPNKRCVLLRCIRHPRSRRLRPPLM
jgi:mitogen-activated protein kinase 1/3